MALHSGTVTAGFVRDEAGWRRRYDTEAWCVAFVDDHRQYVIAGGKADGEKGTFVLDHEQKHVRSRFATREARVETAWIGALGAARRSAYRVSVWLRESENSNISIEVYENWREDLAKTYSISAQQQADKGLRLDEAVLGEGRKWGRRRPFIVRQDIYVTNVETFKIALVGTGRWELLGLKVYSQNHLDDKDRRAPS